MRQVSHPTSPVVTSFVVDSINLFSENYRIDTRPRILGKFSATNHLERCGSAASQLGLARGMALTIWSEVSKRGPRTISMAW
jgi:hypothetical protein